MNNYDLIILLTLGIIFTSAAGVLINMKLDDIRGMNDIVSIEVSVTENDSNDNIIYVVDVPTKYSNDSLVYTNVANGVTIEVKAIY